MTFKTLHICAVMFAGIFAAPAAWSAAEARFSSFSYEGQDDFYNDNPLPTQEHFYNPVIPGWASDPSLVRVGEDYWLVTSTFGYFPGIPLYHSTDLVNWELVRNVLDRPSQLPWLPGQSLDKGGIYAPQISYNPANGLYYVITTDVGKGHFYVTATDPAGEWSDPVFLPEIDGIDPSLFFDDNGQACIVYKEDTEGLPKWSNYRCIRFIGFDPVAGTTVGESVPLREVGVGPEEKLERDEGPHIYKRGGKYYLVCAEGGTGSQHSAVVYKADNMTGPYTRWSRNPMLTQRGLKPNRSNPVTCAGHADLVTTPDGDWWAVFLGSRPQKTHGFQSLGRETFLMPVRWSADSFPYITQNIDTVPLVLSRPGTVRGASPTFGNFRWDDDFSSPSLRPEWLSLRGSVDSVCRLADGALHLMCSNVKASSRGVPAYLGRRVQHHRFEVSATVSFAPRADGERAGLMVLKNESRQFFLAVDRHGVSARQLGKGGSDTELGSVRASMLGRNGKNVSVELRMQCHGDTYSFHCRREGASEWLTVAEGVDAGYVSCERSGGFTGATVGLYAESN